MKQINSILLKTTLAVTSMITLLFIVLFTSSKMIAHNIVDLSSAELLIISAIIISTFVTAFITELKNNNTAIILISSGLLIFLSIFISIIIHSHSLLSDIVVKNIISILCGTFLGLYFGKRRHNKLRSNRKNYRFTTK